VLRKDSSTSCDETSRSDVPTNTLRKQKYIRNPHSEPASPFQSVTPPGLCAVCCFVFVVVVVAVGVGVGVSVGVVADSARLSPRKLRHLERGAKLLRNGCHL